MIPGFAGQQLKGLKVDEREIDRIEAIILSMTPQERRAARAHQGLAAAADRQGLGRRPCSRSTSSSSSSARCAR